MSPRAALALLSLCPPAQTAHHQCGHAQGCIPRPPPTPMSMPDRRPAGNEAAKQRPTSIPAQQRTQPTVNCGHGGRSIATGQFASDITRCDCDGASANGRGHRGQAMKRPSPFPTAPCPRRPTTPSEPAVRCICSPPSESAVCQTLTDMACQNAASLTQLLPALARSICDVARRPSRLPTHGLL